MAVIGFASETDISAAGDFFTETAQIRTKIVVANDAKLASFEVAPKAEGEFFFNRSGEGDGFDFPAELLSGAFGELHAQARGVYAGTLELGQAEEL